MKIKLTVFLLTIGTLILLLVGCKGFGAINNTIPTLQDDKVILNPVNAISGTIINTCPLVSCDNSFLTIH